MKYQWILIFLSFLEFALAQTDYRAADKLFDKMWYVEAAKAYQIAIDQGDRSKEVLEKVGDAHYFNTDMEKAFTYYDQLIATYSEEIEPEYIFRYAHSLSGTGNYKEAKKWMIEFSKRVKYEDSRVHHFSQDEITIEDILKIRPQFALKNLSINTVNSDFAPMFYKDQLVYASAVDSTHLTKSKYRWNEQPYLNLYVGGINPLKKDLSESKIFSDRINTKYHEATVAFINDEKKMFFTRNNFDRKLGKDSIGVTHLKLYTADLMWDKKGEKIWDCIQELPFNSENYSVGHPSVSPDGKKLYFVSDMPGTIGATDIFVVDILEDFQYSKPRNLGKTINTGGREMFPFVTQKGLYFASDGHLGLGGLDVFIAKTDSIQRYVQPVNLGAPLNSNLDDFGFIIKEEENHGYVCSNRKGGKGDDDIYAFDRLKLACNQNIVGSILEQKRKVPIEGVRVLLVDTLGREIDSVRSKINGTFNFLKNYDCNRSFEIRVSKAGYKKNSKPVATTAIHEQTQEIVLPMEKELNKLIISENGMLKINIDNIYFDLSKHYIRDDAALELDKVVSVMLEYPEMIIKIESHTDSRGSDAYNLKLSRRRAASTKEYIISKGIERPRIKSAIGYGETQLLNNCSNGVKCSDKKHDQNRRSEFIIVTM